MNEQSPYRQSVRLLRRLHELIADGKGDLPEADEVRDQMDGPWYRMTADEHELMNLLSADLYTLSEEPPPAPAPSSSAREAFEAALRDKQWREVLTWLHREPGLVDAGRAALVRAGAWSALGEPAIAEEFIWLANRLFGLLDDSRPNDPPALRRKGPPANLPAFRTIEIAVSQTLETRP